MSRHDPDYDPGMDFDGDGKVDGFEFEMFLEEMEEEEDWAIGKGASKDSSGGGSRSGGLGGYDDDDAGACYIATCAYGSYDCPEVWVLRRFRDDVLAQNGFGRWFIELYYSVSPGLVKVFGSSRHVKRIWRKSLDPLVSALQKRGFSNKPYTD